MVDWLLLVLLFFAGIIVVLHLTNARNRSSSPRGAHIVRSTSLSEIARRLDRNPLWTPGNGEVLDETIETYNRSHQPEDVVMAHRIVRDIINRDRERPQNNNPNTNTCYVNWRNVEGDDEAISENENEDNLQCKVCFTNKINTVFMPCFHAAVCITCANRLQETKICPICRNRIHTPRRLFL